MTLSLLPNSLPDADRRSRFEADCAPRSANITVVVPVRDNSSGIERIARWWDERGAAHARELILVDDGSSPPLRVEVSRIRVLRTTGVGPAGARNLGWRAAQTPWVAFLDSDCVPEGTWPASFARGWSGELAIQGRVRALGADALSAFYETQEVLRPMSWDRDGRPGYLITANALVLHEALELVGGFDRRFRLAAGEDVDLGMRLARVGRLRWAPEATVAHDFEPTVTSLVRRFFRYGRGNRLLAQMHDPEALTAFTPRPFAPREPSATNHLLAVTAYASLWAGWMYERNLCRSRER